MSRPPGHKQTHSRSHRSTNPHPTPSLQELQTRWSALRLKGPTQAHLERLLQVEGGILIVLAATQAFSLEQEREGQKLVPSIITWAVEELRSLFLEEGSSHMVEAGRILVDRIIAWNVFGHLAAWMLSWTTLFLALGALCLYCLLCWSHARRVQKQTPVDITDCRAPNQSI